MGKRKKKANQSATQTKKNSNKVKVAEGHLPAREIKEIVSADTIAAIQKHSEMLLSLRPRIPKDMKQRIQGKGLVRIQQASPAHSLHDTNIHSGMYYDYQGMYEPIPSFREKLVEFMKDNRYIVPEQRNLPADPFPMLNCYLYCYMDMMEFARAFNDHKELLMEMLQSDLYQIVTFDARVIPDKDDHIGCFTTETVDNIVDITAAIKEQMSTIVADV